MFVVLTGVPLAALGWLAWRVLEQDRTLEAQRLDTAVNQLIRTVGNTLASWEGLAAKAATDGDAGSLPAGSIAVLVDSAGASWRSGIHLPYYPHVPPSDDVPEQPFAVAEALELKEGNLTRAAAAYHTVASSSPRSVQAVALSRVARVLRKAGKLAEALAVYESVAEFEDIPIAGFPAGLIARRERVVLLTQLGRKEHAAEERRLLASLLLDGRFAVDRAGFDFVGEVALDDVDPVAASRIRIANAVDHFWSIWREQPSGRSAWTSEGRTFVTAWKPVPRGIAALVAPLETIAAPVRAMASDLQLVASIDDANNRQVTGSSTDASVLVTRPLRDAGVSLVLRLSAADGNARRAAAVSRRNLYLAGFSLMAVVIGAAGYSVFRAVNRELGVARLQSEFVAAVSHEFRTPLTAMCHLTEVLEEGAAPDARLPDYYHALGKESRRLHALVERLLDFGRMEAGRRVYDFAVIDASGLVARLLEESREQLSAKEHRLDLRRADAPSPIRADRDALTLAIRNLLDNAVKYSPPSRRVGVSVTCNEASVRIAVDDEGPGIPQEEKTMIFRKFARGAAARTLNVKGTGIGLAMVEEIVRAHHGRIHVESALGRGSSFAIVLPRCV